MKRMMALAMCVAVAPLFLFSIEDQVQEPKYYDNAKVVRIRHIEGEGFVRRSYEEGNEEAVVNLPVFEKDEVGTTDGRMEIYLGRLNYLRLDSDTIVALTSLPLPRQTETSIRLIQGGIYLDVDNLDIEKGIEVQTPDCGIFLLDRGIYRVNILGDGATEVLVFEGTAEVSGKTVSRNIRENQKIVMELGDMMKRPYYFYTSERDGFDSWNASRNQELGYARLGSSRYLDNGYEDYEYELSQSGRWVYMDEFRMNCWIPYSIDSYWRPYYNGRWVWHPYYGNVWSSYDPWGWFTHYHGRWHWHNHYGWYWLPGYHWSPAWVSWYWDDYYYGWCPLSWWNRPVIVFNNHWHRNHHFHHGLPFHGQSTIVIRKNELANPNIHRVALRDGELTSLSAKSVAFRNLVGPKERAAVNRVSVMNASGRSMIYKENGIVSTEKYQINRSLTNRSAGSEAAGKYVGKSVVDRSSSRYTTRNTTDSRKSKDDSSSSGYGSRSVRSSNSGSRSNSGSSARSSNSGSRSSSSARSGSSSGSKSSSGGSSKSKKDEPYSPSSIASTTSGSYESDTRYTSRSQFNSNSGNKRGTIGTTRYASRSQGSSVTSRSADNSENIYRSNSRTVGTTIGTTPRQPNYRNSYGTPIGTTPYVRRTQSTSSNSSYESPMTSRSSRSSGSNEYPTYSAPERRSSYRETPSYRQAERSESSRSSSYSAPERSSRSVSRNSSSGSSYSGSHSSGSRSISSGGSSHQSASRSSSSSGSSRSVRKRD